MNYFLRLPEIPKTGCLLGASVDTVVLVTINLKMNSFRDSSVFSKAKVRPATFFNYKFTLVYRKSVNLIGYIRVVYVLIDNSCTRECTRDPFSSWRATFEADVTMKQSFSTPCLTFFLFMQ